MNTESENPNAARPEEAARAREAEGAAPPRKTFVEPRVSFPVDVLEATTFFQVAESSSTDPGA